MITNEIQYCTLFASVESSCTLKRYSVQAHFSQFTLTTNMNVSRRMI